MLEKMETKVLLSHQLGSDTPTYGNRNRVVLAKTSDIKSGDTSNDTYLSMTVHSGTHIDMPKHFYDEGQVWSDFALDIWFFNKPLMVRMEPDSYIISEQLIVILDKEEDKKSYDILLVDTGFVRTDPDQIVKNYGFSAEVAEYLNYNFPNVRAFGFDSLSVSSLTNRALGRAAHKAFLNPDHPILLIEDMNFNNVRDSQLEKILVAPLFIKDCDAMPCTIFGFIKE